MIVYGYRCGILMLPAVFFGLVTHAGGGSDPSVGAAVGGLIAAMISVRRTKKRGPE